MHLLSVDVSECGWWACAASMLAGNVLHTTTPCVSCVEYSWCLVGSLLCAAQPQLLGPRRPLDADYRIERSNRDCSRVEHYDSTEKRNALVQGPVRAFCHARLEEEEEESMIRHDVGLRGRLVV